MKLIYWFYIHTVSLKNLNRKKEGNEKDRRDEKRVKRREEKKRAKREDEKIEKTNRKFKKKEKVVIKE